ncbi:hypothetical protein KKF34_16700 [Myxococcota bacterium]|nr:hypothetical protein [Myxococcota bacterium]MBU1379769.1 hypothetical protein [Myxococcota bacterium]MBU1498518.1 hypothetical protein [Myxococcota bacterium]
MGLEENRNFQQRITLLDQSIDKLRVLYEQFFMGIEKFEPVNLRREVKNELRYMRENPPTNTAQKFLLNKTDTKYKTYEQYWNRILREIEDGVYHRQISKLKRQVEREGLSSEMLDNIRTKGELEAAMASLASMREKASQKAPSSDPTPAHGSSPTGSQPKVIDTQLRAAYEAFVRARLKTGESLEGITPERFQATLAQKIPIVKKTYDCNEVEIKIAIKDGKATLSFVPRKTE